MEKKIEKKPESRNVREELLLWRNSHIHIRRTVWRGMDYGRVERGTGNDARQSTAGTFLRDTKKGEFPHLPVHRKANEGIRIGSEKKPASSEGLGFLGKRIRLNVHFTPEGEKKKTEGRRRLKEFEGRHLSHITLKR